MSDDKIRDKIVNNQYGLFDKIMYGGVGYGYFCMPTNIFKIIATVIFPPLGILIENIGKIDTSFPYIRKENMKNIINSIGEFIYSFVLTMLFYIPGLIYTLNKIKVKKFDPPGDNYNSNNYDDDEKFENTTIEEDEELYDTSNLEKLKEALFDD
jgi:uncharacterized membrane protein YqaE (UPF0057 family)